MTAGEIAQWQKRCGFRTDAAAAGELRVHPITFYRYRRGKTPVPEPIAELCFRIEADQDLDPERLAQLSEMLARLVRLHIFRRR